MRTANPYKTIAKATHFKRFPIVEQNGDELMVLNKGKAFYEMYLMNRSGNCTVSRIYKDGKRACETGLWKLTKNTDSEIRAVSIFGNGERVKMYVSDSAVRINKYKM